MIRPLLPFAAFAILAASPAKAVDVIINESTPISPAPMPRSSSNCTVVTNNSTALVFDCTGSSPRIMLRAPVVLP